VSQEGQVVGGVGEEHEFEVTVDVRAVGVAGAVLRVVTLRVRQTQVRPATHCLTAHSIEYTTD